MKKNAVVKFVDALGRAVVLTEDNEALVVDAPPGVAAGDMVELHREEGMRRRSDWKMRPK